MREVWISRKKHILTIFLAVPVNFFMGRKHTQIADYFAYVLLLYGFWPSLLPTLDGDVCSSLCLSCRPTLPYASPAIAKTCARVDSSASSSPTANNAASASLTAKAPSSRQEPLEQSLDALGENQIGFSQMLSAATEAQASLEI